MMELSFNDQSPESISCSTNIAQSLKLVFGICTLSVWSNCRQSQLSVSSYAHYRKLISAYLLLRPKLICALSLFRLNPYSRTVVKFILFLLPGEKGIRGHIRLIKSSDSAKQ